jgi:hypothetical protein
MPKKTHARPFSSARPGRMSLPAASQDSHRSFFAITSREVVRDLSSCSGQQPDQLRRPVVGRSASATIALGVAECATARRETRHNRLSVIASASLWLRGLASPPTSSTRQARVPECVHSSVVRSQTDSRRCLRQILDLRGHRWARTRPCRASYLLLARLSDRYHLVAPDYPGFGHGDWPDPKQFAYTFDHIAEVMNHFTEKLGLSHYSLYMQDYGGPVGLLVEPSDWLRRRLS